MPNIINAELQPRVGIKPSISATFPDLVKRFFESIKKKCCELSFVNSESTNNKQANDNKVDSQLSWIIASLGQVAHFTSVVIRNVLATSGWVRFAHTAPYAKSAHNSLVKAIAFTLAETLVVMGIIGVVAALTIPNLNQSTGDREKVAKVKKIYSNLEDAFGRATAVYGPYDTWFTGLSEYADQRKRIGQRLTEFMKVSKDCGVVENSDNNTCYKDGGGYSIITADGTAMAMETYTIYVDIDGPNKGKNDLGYDQFWFDVTNDGIVPQGCNYDVDESELFLFSTPLAVSCWVIRNGNMDYLKVDTKEIGGNCPNGTTLDWTTNTSCK